MNLKDKIKKLEKRLKLKQKFYCVIDNGDSFVIKSNGVERKLSPKEYEEWEKGLNEDAIVYHRLSDELLMKLYEEKQNEFIS